MPKTLIELRREVADNMFQQIMAEGAMLTAITELPDNAQSTKLLQCYSDLKHAYRKYNESIEEYNQAVRGSIE